MMPIRLQTAIQDRRLTPWAALCSSGDEKPRHEPIKPVAKKSRSTMRDSAHCLPYPSDLEAALSWRLDGIPIQELEAVADALRPFADDFRENRPEVAALLADLYRPGDRRSGWTLACSVLAWDALRRCDVLTFGAAMTEVLAAMRQGKRGGWKRAPAPDALDDLIDAHRQATPPASAASLFDQFADMAGGAGVLVEFDDGADELVCQLDPDSEVLTNIGRDEFARRVRRLR